MRHYHFGGGRSVDLMEIGHLNEIAERYAYEVGTKDRPDGEGAFRRLAGQIATEARKTAYGAFIYPFRGSYDFGAVQFSHGGGTVFGEFQGFVTDNGDLLRISGEAWFTFTDTFTDPLGLGEVIGLPLDLPTATPYAVSGSWTARFIAEVRIAAHGSLYFDPKIERGQKCRRS